MFKLFTFLMSMFSQYNNIYSQEICVGDIDNNLSVDVNDLLGVLSNFGSEGDIIEDIDMNGIVDVNDLLGVLSNYGTECNASVYPEDPLPIAPVDPTCVLGDDCGNQVWTECGTSCPPICGSPEPMMCNMMCNVGYQCPHDLWWDTGNCVSPELCSEILILPPDIAIGRPFIKNNSNIHSLIVYEKNDWNEVF